MIMIIRMIMIVISSILTKSKSHFNEKKENESLLRVDIGDCGILCRGGDVFVPG
jgi:predicted ribosome-associated RNA-binding protein Tma20